MVKIIIHASFLQKSKSVIPEAILVVNPLLKGLKNLDPR